MYLAEEMNALVILWCQRDAVHLYSCVCRPLSPRTNTNQAKAPARLLIASVEPALKHVDSSKLRVPRKPNLLLDKLPTY